MNISGYDSNSISMLFSSMSGTRKNSQSSPIFDMSGLSSCLSDYASIRNGSYYKVANAYCKAMREQDGKGENVLVKDKESTQNRQKLLSAASAGDQLKEAASALKQEKLYEKRTIVKDGKAVSEYDMDTLSKKVGDFVKEYNDMIKVADRSVDEVQTSAISMIQQTAGKATMLAKAGITIETDYTLKFDEKAFQKANVSDVKALFYGTGSYGDRIGNKAGAITKYAKSQTARSSSYDQLGRKTYDLSSGSFINRDL